MNPQTMGNNRPLITDPRCINTLDAGEAAPVPIGPPHHLTTPKTPLHSTNEPRHRSALVTEIGHKEHHSQREEERLPRPVRKHGQNRRQCARVDFCERNNGRVSRPDPASRHAAPFAHSAPWRLPAQAPKRQQSPQTKACRSTASRERA